VNHQLFSGVGISSLNLSKYAACFAGSNNYSNRCTKIYMYVHSVFL